MTLKEGISFSTNQKGHGLKMIEKHIWIAWLYIWKRWIDMCVCIYVQKTDFWRVTKIWQDLAGFLQLSSITFLHWSHFYNKHIQLYTYINILRLNTPLLHLSMKTWLWWFHVFFSSQVVRSKGFTSFSEVKNAGQFTEEQSSSKVYESLYICGITKHHISNIYYLLQFCCDRIWELRGWAVPVKGPPRGSAGYQYHR